MARLERRLQRRRHPPHSVWHQRPRLGALALACLGQTQASWGSGRRSRSARRPLPRQVSLERSRLPPGGLVLEVVHSGQRPLGACSALPPRRGLRLALRLSSRSQRACLALLRRRLVSHSAHPPLTICLGCRSNSNSNSSPPRTCLALALSPHSSSSSPRLERGCLAHSLRKAAASSASKCSSSSSNSSLSRSGQACLVSAAAGSSWLSLVPEAEHRPQRVLRAMPRCNE